ncbi:hypothetical protein VitviT2T_010598 [Vitis vinifera]|uniref:AB hydrolase-1 domain-containing protein n=1 Tax=Vitis vinifera TaxID=29760 RepID=A0ABY9C8V0_VITVI|nr:hypothetical protein VitviT2T_010598 [Vitis vinifera]
MDRGKHFVLVHGAGHGAWCWYKLVPLLKSFGHSVTALDLGSSGVNPKSLDELASAYDYVQPLMEFVASLPQDEKVVLVGHSYGGLPISLAMESFPQKILVAVFVSAYMPNYISPPITQAQEFLINRIKPESLLDSQLSFGLGLESLPTAVTFGPDYVSVALYQHCQPEDLELAKSLVRPHGLFLEDLAKESLLSKEKFGSVDRVYVVLEKDEVMKEDFQRWVIDDSPPKEVKFIAGADHMVQAWCWYKLVPLLKSFGHRVTALDLGASGVNPKRLDELASVYDNVQPLMEFVASLPQDEKVVLVGHSYGGLAISLAMESFPEKILVGVFVSAYMPNYISPPVTLAQEFFINRSKPESLLDTQLSFGQGLESPPTALTFGPDHLSVALYQNCQPEVCNGVCCVDKASRVVPGRLRQGTDHMVMISRPKELCLCFQEIVQQYN